MPLQLSGTMSRDRNKKPMLPHEDSAIKKAMRSVSKLMNANKVKAPSIMRKAEGM